MQYARTRAFDKTLRKLSSQNQLAVERAIGRLVRAFDLGERTEGLGLKKLRRDFWEIRSGLSIRILFTLENQLVTFVIVGKHEEIQRYLRGA